MDSMCLAQILKHSKYSAPIYEMKGGIQKKKKLYVMWTA